MPVESPFEHHHDWNRTTGFLTEEYQFEGFSFEDDIDTSVVIAGFNQFARIKTSLTEKRQNHKNRSRLCLRGKLPGVIKPLSPWLKTESKYF